MPKLMAAETMGLSREPTVAVSLNNHDVKLSFKKLCE